jgi:hypothetical protein
MFLLVSVSLDVNCKIVITRTSDVFPTTNIKTVVLSLLFLTKGFSFPVFITGCATMTRRHTLRRSYLAFSMHNNGEAPKWIRNFKSYCHNIRVEDERKKICPGSNKYAPRTYIPNDTATSNVIRIGMPKPLNCFFTYFKHFAADNSNYFDMTQ